jgi:replication factor A1
VFFHHALVDDLISREEFDRKVEEKIQAAGGLLDEHTAAMLVVQELGRSHTKIANIVRGVSLCSFFGKLLALELPREFQHADGSPGRVARLRLGDESGVISAVLWDDRADAVEELECGGVIEVIGRPSRSGPLEIHVLDLRPASCQIVCDEWGGLAGGPNGTIPEVLDVVLLGLDPQREFPRRDGSMATVREGLIGHSKGTFRFTCWAPELLGGIEPPATVRLHGVREKEGPFGKEYHLDARGRVEPWEEEVKIPCTPPAKMEEGNLYSVSGTITALTSPRTFRKGEGTSWVRNCTLQEGKETCSLVLWGDQALIPLAEWDVVILYHLRAKKGRTGEQELHSVRGTVLQIRSEPGERVVCEGIVLPGITGVVLDTGEEVYLVEGDLPLYVPLRVEGRLSGRRLTPLQYQGIRPDRQDLLARLDTL